MPRGNRANWGGRRSTSRPDAKKAGRPKVFAAVRIPLAQTPPLVDWLIAQHNHMAADDPAEPGMAFLIAGLWSELNAPRE